MLRKFGTIRYIHVVLLITSIGYTCTAELYIYIAALIHIWGFSTLQHRRQNSKSVERHMAS